MCVTEAVFIPEQIEQYKFGALSKINGKFNLKLNNFNCMTLQFRLNSLRNFITILHDFEKYSSEVVLLKKFFV